MKQYVASHLKDMNRQIVYQIIKEKGETSKAEISKLSGISPPTVIKIISFLQEQGLILELGEGTNAIGRKPQMLCLNTRLMYAAAFFLEGDFLTMGIVDILGKVIHKKSIKVEPDFDTVIKDISKKFIDELLMETGISEDRIFGIGIALPAIYDPKKNSISGGLLMKGQEKVDISGQVRKLEEKYGAFVVIENDANAQALGEFSAGPYDAEDDLMLISIGTGMGAGVILNGKLRRGNQNMCGEIGYISFICQHVTDIKTPGWLETAIGYRKLEEKFSVDITEDVSVLSNSIPTKKKQEMIDYVAPLVALCINNTGMFLDCTNIILGGKVAEILGSALIDAINIHLQHMCVAGLRVKAESSDDIGLIGIASLVTEKKIHRILTADN